MNLQLSTSVSVYNVRVSYSKLTSVANKNDSQNKSIHKIVSRNLNYTYQLKLQRAKCLHLSKSL